MTQPRTRVIQLECNSKITVGRYDGDVATRRVGGGETGIRGVEDARFLAYDPEVVPVQVEGVVETEAGLVFNDENSPLVRVVAGYFLKQDVSPL